ncbi:hypothetical protein MKY07_07200 [Solibacillus sp. FSL W7-1472]|uniref:Uncharacterized protein n=1 Tax=Solibacillus isronensis B3W22 TaxID=1224748 RepID=K1LGS1_9BACL|nr:MULTISPECIES: hypothetical protein [Solibacillus]AMO85097.1 hypothetical protein SOLI23_05715 [Solibacillus silvestris]EKB43694.1 hypothetical protein B857_03532 [Solibacillus isronensis B3W22]OBW55939.1 hypothetical protein A9986_12860 [Solibacillus silvestris]
MRQLNLFELEFEQHQPKFQLMDTVKVILIDEQLDSETYHYRKFYEAHIINKAGEITNIHISPAGVTYEVDIYGAKYYLLEEELI